MPARTRVVAAALALAAFALPGCIIVVDESGETRYAGDYAGHKANRRQIGVTLGGISETTASQLRLDGSRVCVIEHVYEGTPADRAGLREHDIVTQIAGWDGGASVEQLRSAIRTRQEGEELRLTVLREGHEHEITVIPERR